MLKPTKLILALSLIFLLANSTSEDCFTDSCVGCTTDCLESVEEMPCDWHDLSCKHPNDNVK